MSADEHFDYLIVGAGSAGCVLANRLSADPQARVVLLEAGGSDRSIFIQAPGGLLPIMYQGWFSWIYPTVPQRHANNRVMFSPRGKVLGGSSSINGMVYDRGARSDYDEWSRLGNEGWSYDEVLPYFRRLESYAPANDEYHGNAGPVLVTRPGIRHPLAKAFLAAATSAGLPYNDDTNGLQREGVGPTDVTAAAGRRYSSARSYLRTIAHRSNLRVVINAQVTRLLFEGRRAVGVEYLQRGERRRARAAREVIVSAGAIASPHLLLVSGVGDAAHLRAVGVPVIHDLKGVGQNYRDHVAVTVKQACKLPISLYNFFSPWAAAKSVVQFAFFNRGPLADSSMEVVAYMRTMPESMQPDVKIHFAMALYEAMGRKIIKQHGFFAHVDLLQPQSVGELKLGSADPLAPPLIDPNILSTEHDMALGRSAIRAVRHIFAQPAFDGLRGPELGPGQAVQSDADLDAYLRATASADIHTCGTCRMGRDALAVVDAQLRVHGLEGLRVVDASVMPRVPSGNTNVPTMMIAEKATDMILGKATAR